MRVLAIRAKNLASLPSFEIDLEHGPLSRTRIFAITGPTGAGKSTLLDALCLALYDRAPRLENARDVFLRELEVGASDPRSLVRRGTAEAWAEVDFVGCDGVRYRARWEAWRARKKADGALQPQRLALFALAPAPGDATRDLTGATKTETLRRIEEKVGLSFTEFRRAVLLAQGDFAAFLGAKPDQRAELLERMTGSEIYAEISRAAFVRAKAEDERLHLLEAEKERLHVLAPAEREALIAARAALADERRSLEAELDRARAAARWHESRARLEAELTETEQAFLAANEAWARAEGTRRTLAMAEEAERLRPLHDASTAAARDAELARARATKADEEATKAGAERHIAESSAHQSEVALRALRDEAERIAPDLARAKTLDALIAEAARAHDLAAAEARAATRTAGDALRAVDALRAEEERRRTVLEALDRRIAGAADAARLAAQWPRWSDELGRYAEATRARARHEAELDARAGELARARATLAGRRAKLEAAEAVKRAAAEARLAASAEPTAAPALAGPERRWTTRDVQEALERLAVELESLEAMRGLSTDARRIARQHAEDTKRAKAEKKLAVEKKRAVAELKRRLEGLEPELAHVREEKDLAARRGDLLRAGEPCPLCGALEHPAVAGEPERPSRARSLKRKLDRLAKELEDARATLETTEREAAAHAKEAEHASRRRVELGPELEQKTADWHARRDSLRMMWVDSPVLAGVGAARVGMLIPESFEGRTVAQDLEHATAELLAHQKALKARLEAEAARSQAVERARRAEVEADEAVEVARSAAESASGTERSLAERASDAAARLDAARARADEALAELEQAIGPRADWRAELTADPAGARAHLAREVEAYEKDRLTRADEAEHLRRLAAELELARAEATRRSEAHARAEGVEASARAVLEERRAARRALLDGRAAEEVSESLGHRTRAAEERAAEARALALASSEAALQATERAAHAVTRAREAEAALRIASAELDHALERTPSFADRDALAAVLAADPAALAHAREHLRALADERTRLEATAADRRERLHAHLAARPTAEGLDEVRRSIGALEAKHRAAVEADVLTAEKLARDDALRAELDALVPELERQRRAAERWAELSALIGSADGKKLRTFAQGLTLDALVDRANAHLAALRPRYRLERVAGHDMELAVVDGDLGGELRAVATLSGGETFLVSLALALGLSTLSAKETAIQSLFVDEGFGSLDPASLEVALATLDQLQAEGRTIGLISHVPELAERLGYQILVRPVAPGRSEVTVVET